MGSSSVSVKKGGTTDGALGKTLRSEIQRRSQHLLADGGSLSQTLEIASSGFGEPGKPLPPLLQRAFGPYDLSSVQVHQGPKAQQAAKALQATAYTRGEHIVVGDSPSLHTLAHEAAHVVQQRNPQAGLGQGLSEPGQSSELHADAVASRVLQGGQVTDLLARVSPLGQAAPLAGSPPPLVMRKKEMTAHNAQSKILKHYNRNDDLQEYCKEVLRRQAANAADAYTIISYFWKYTPVDKGIKAYDYYRSSWESVAKEKNIGEYPNQFDVAPKLVYSQDDQSNLSNLQKQGQANIVAKYQRTNTQKSLANLNKGGQLAQDLSQLTPVADKLDSGGQKIFGNIKSLLSKDNVVKKDILKEEESVSKSANFHDADYDDEIENSAIQKEPIPDEFNSLFAEEDYLGQLTLNNDSSGVKTNLLGNNMNISLGIEGTFGNFRERVARYISTAPVQVVKQFSKGTSSLLYGTGAVIKASSQMLHASLLEKQTIECYDDFDKMKLNVKMYDEDAKNALLEAISILKIYPIAGNVDAASGLASSGMEVASMNDGALVSVNKNTLEEIKEIAPSANKSTLSHELKKSYDYKHSVHSIVQNLKSKVGHSSSQKDAIASAIAMGLKSVFEFDRIVARRILVELLLVDTELLMQDADTLAEHVRTQILKG